MFRTIEIINGRNAFGIVDHVARAVSSHLIRVVLVEIRLKEQTGIDLQGHLLDLLGEFLFPLNRIKGEQFRRPTRRLFNGENQWTFD